MSPAASGRSLPWDWYNATIPQNADVHETAFVETTYSFLLCRSELPDGVRIGYGSGVYLGTMFDVGPRGRVTIGKYALVHGAWFICDAAVEIGDYALISWNVVLLDTYRVPLDPVERRWHLRRVPFAQPRRVAAHVAARPIRVGNNVWLGFDSCVLPGVTIGDGSIVGARSVVTQDVPPYTLVAGNPARVIREIEHDEPGQAK